MGESRCQCPGLDVPATHNPCPIPEHHSVPQGETFRAPRTEGQKLEQLGVRPGRPGDYVIKDSGERRQFDSGMQRDTADDKLKPHLTRDGPMFLRWAIHMTNGAKKYDARNWMKATGKEEFDRFLESADRHFATWYFWHAFGINIEDPENPTTDPPKEDHAAAVFFNINGVEYVGAESRVAALERGPAS